MENLQEYILEHVGNFGELKDNIEELIDKQNVDKDKILNLIKETMENLNKQLQVQTQLYEDVKIKKKQHLKLLNNMKNF